MKGRVCSMRSNFKIIKVEFGRFIDHKHVEKRGEIQKYKFWKNVCTNEAGCLYLKTWNNAM